ncbi:uncharacterized protein IUM83_06194 [Phytophthora cinnamomi]|uniref:uncharacterized protein n=1 Tax=Phytophthora cinnamomi TaxID=4785 RepID=UPI00355A1A56|nr:hypothetical protein IUM83_06194 [Phytophthora cinnamomi]
MQDSVMLALAKVLAAVWREALDAPGSDDVREELQDAPWTLRLRSPRQRQRLTRSGRGAAAAQHVLRAKPSSCAGRLPVCD